PVLPIPFSIPRIYRMILITRFHIHYRPLGMLLQNFSNICPYGVTPTSMSTLYRMHGEPRLISKPSRRTFPRSSGVIRDEGLRSTYRMDSLCHHSPDRAIVMICSVPVVISGPVSP